MQMHLSGMEGIQLAGRIGRVRVSDGALRLDIRLERPLGWSAAAALDRADAWRLLWLLIKSPAVWGFLLFKRRPHS
jgi:hypothetical protein